MSNIQLENLPDEVILNVLCYLETKDLMLCSHASKRMRELCLDGSLWKNINIYDKTVPTEFLELVLNNGCQYLSLCRSRLKGNLCLHKPSHLKYLNLSFCKSRVKTVDDLIDLCHFLQKFPRILCGDSQYVFVFN